MTGVHVGTDGTKTFQVYGRSRVRDGAVVVLALLQRAPQHLHTMPETIVSDASRTVDTIAPR